jgi:transposase
MALSMELRERIAFAHENGLGTYADIATFVGCGEATVSRVLRRKRETGSVAPKHREEQTKPKIDSRGLEMLKRWLEEQSDATLDELKRRYNACESTENVSRATIGRAVRDRLGMTRKKRPIEQHKETGRTSSRNGVSFWNWCVSS